MSTARLLLLLLVAGCLAYASQARVLKAAHGRDHAAWKRGMHAAKDEVAPEARVKRFAFMAAMAAGSAVFGLAQQAHDLYYGWRLHRRDGLSGGESSPHAVWESLGTVADTMDQLSARVEHLMAAAPDSDDEDLQTLARDFAGVVQRLDSLRPDVRLQFNAEERIVTDAAAEEWAEDVLAEGAGGVPGLMTELHELVVGGLVSEYWALVLEPQGRGEGPELERLVEDLLDMERLGYSYWVLALGLDDQTSEIEAVEELMTERLATQSIHLVTDPRVLAEDSK